MPTAPIGAACPIWPTTPVSTAPSSGTVAFERTMGAAILRTRAWVISAIAARIARPAAFGHKEVARSRGEKARPVVLPGLDMHTRIAPARPVDPRPRIGVARQAGAEVVDRQVDGLRQPRKVPGREAQGVEAAGLHLFPGLRPGQFDDRGHLEEGRRHPAV